jgi:hypothetical protein
VLGHLSGFVTHRKQVIYKGIEGEWNGNEDAFWIDAKQEIQGSDWTLVYAGAFLLRRRVGGEGPEGYGAKWNASKMRIEKKEDSASGIELGSD